MSARRDELVAVFKEAWHAADERGETGHRTEAGIDAVLAAVLGALNEAFSGDEYAENARGAAAEDEWSWFKWLATTAVRGEAHGGLICGCGHPMTDHSHDGTRACMAPVSEKYDCPCISTWVSS